MERRRNHTSLTLPDRHIDSPYSVVLVGRTNVGKSTLFNRLTETELALASAEAHLTRDRQTAPITWRKFEFNLTDTGGWDVENDTPYGKEITQQVTNAIISASIVVLVVEHGKPHPVDRKLAIWLREKGKKVIVVANKADHGRRGIDPDALELGYEVFPVSALSGAGTGDVLDALVSELQQTPVTATIGDIPRGRPISVVFLGRPNVGKSSLVNALLGEQRVIVSEHAHTTRTAQIIPFAYGTQAFQLIDTAGLRKRAKANATAEKSSSYAEVMSAQQTEAAVRIADVVGLVVDITQPLATQDSRLAEIAVKWGKSLIIIGNKWDALHERGPQIPTRIKANIYAHYPYLTWAPIVLTSAISGHRITDILETAIIAWKERFRTLPDQACDRFLQQMIKRHPPSRGKGVHHPRLLSFIQLRSDPPTFELLTEYFNLAPAYLRFMEKELRAKFGFTGTPIRIHMRPLIN